MIKLICLHFVADFLLQSREMGKKKSEEVKWLSYHLLIQFLIFVPFTGWRFSLVNALIHGLIDWNIWKLYKYSVFRRCIADDLRSLKEHPDRFTGSSYSKLKVFKYWEDHLFYSTIGLDQSLHMMTLYLLSLIF